jgi:hypothetical protein
MTTLTKNPISSEDLVAIKRSLILLKGVASTTKSKDLEEYLNNVVSTLSIDLMRLQGFGE